MGSNHSQTGYHHTEATVTLAFTLTGLPHHSASSLGDTDCHYKLSSISGNNIPNSIATLLQNATVTVQKNTKVILDTSEQAILDLSARGDVSISLLSPSATGDQVWSVNSRDFLGGASNGDELLKWVLVQARDPVHIAWNKLNIPNKAINSTRPHYAIVPTSMTVFVGVEPSSEPTQDTQGRIILRGKMTMLSEIGRKRSISDTSPDTKSPPLSSGSKRIRALRGT